MGIDFEVKTALGYSILARVHYRETGPVENHGMRRQELRALKNANSLEDIRVQVGGYTLHDSRHEPTCLPRYYLLQKWDRTYWKIGARHDLCPSYWSWCDGGLVGMMVVELCKTHARLDQDWGVGASQYPMPSEGDFPAGRGYAAVISSDSSALVGAIDFDVGKAGFAAEMYLSRVKERYGDQGNVIYVDGEDLGFLNGLTV